MPNDIQEYDQPQKITGTYDIKNDTLYLKSNSFVSKAIVTDDFIELFDFPVSKIKIVRNQSSIKRFNTIKLPADFTVFRFLNSQKSFEHLLGKNAECDSPKQNDFETIRNLIQKEIDKAPHLFSKHKKQSKYWKQCLFIKKNTIRSVLIFGVSNKDENRRETWQTQIHDPADGGEYFFNMKIDLSTGKVDFFQIHSNG